MKEDKKYTDKDRGDAWIRGGETGTVSNETMLISAGVRPIAECSVNHRNVDECVRIIKNEGLCYMLDPDGETHTAIYIFKYPYLENIINFYIGKPYDETIWKEWIYGKMFGYSDEEIARFIARSAKIAKLKNDEERHVFYNKEMEIDGRAGRRWAARYEKKRKQEKIPTTRG